MNKLISLSVLLLALFIFGCSDNATNNPTGGNAEVKTFKNLRADASSVKFIRYLNLKADSFAYFSLKDSTIVPSTDSATTKWDIAFNSTGIYINSGLRGPGNTSVIVMPGTDFNTLMNAPEAGYKFEESLTTSAVASQGNWYNYDPATHIISPKASTVLVIRTTDGKFIKMRILSYYKDNPATPDAGSTGKYYTFEYVYQPNGTNDFSVAATYFSFKDGVIVPATDSATTKWDISFFSTSIYLNSGVRGPGQAGVLIMNNTDFNELKEAPETGYKTEESISPTAMASQGNWYNYDPVNHIISAKPGLVLVIKTADGKYAKMRIMSYYKDNPSTPDQTSLGRFYTFEYVYQKDGSRKF